MTDPASPTEMNVRPPRRSPWRNLSVVWLVPLLALVVSLGIAWRSFSERGVLIEIVFQNAAGVTAGETTLQYRDVVIGRVEKLGFTDNLEEVMVSARIDKSVASHLNDTAKFWVVRPEVSARGVTGLSTVLSGVYIEGTWEKTGGAAPKRFTGLEQRPLIDANEQGTWITLTANDGNVTSTGTPVYYRGVQVGRTETPKLDDNGAVVLVRAFIEAPHDRLLTTATRFWNTSGFSVSFGASGLSLDVGSLSALLSGGVAFSTFFEGGDPIKDGQVYDLFRDQKAAQESAFERVSGNTVTLATVFKGGVSGLTAQSAVQFKGLKVGEVTSISAFVTGEGDDLEVNQQVIMSIEPELLGLPADASLDDVLDLLAPAVADGLRARVQTANIIGSSLIVELTEIEDAAPAELDRTAEPYPVIPSVPSQLRDINATLEGVMKRINGLKIEDLIQQAVSTLASIEAIATDPQTRDAPKALTALLDDARAILGSDETRALPGELRDAIADLRKTIEQINSDGVVGKLASTLESADTAMANLSTASDDLPALVDDLRDVATKAKGLQVEELISAGTRFLDSADALIDTDDARSIPPALTGALDQMRDLLAELRQGGAVQNTNAALASARSAAESLEKASAGLPDLTRRLDSLIARSEQLIAAYGARSDFNAETLSMLREIRSAARTVSSLARSLERSPNSLLFGR